MDSRHPPRCVQKFGRDLWSIVGNYENGSHVAPSTELHVSNDDFPKPQNYSDVQRQTKTSIDVHHEAPSDDYWNICGDKSLSGHLIGVTRFELLNKNTGRTYVRSRQTDEETSHYKTRTFLARGMVKNVEQRSAKSQKYMEVEGNPN